MAQRGGGRVPRFFDQARQQYFYHDSRTNEYVYENGTRVPVPVVGARSSTDPRTPYPDAFNSAQQISASQSRPQDATSPTRESGYGYSVGAQSSSTGGRRQSISAVSNVDERMANMSLSNEPNVSTRRYEYNGITVTDAQNNQSQVRTLVGTYPPNRITDPALLQAGISAQGLLMVADGQAADLYPRFRLQSRGFFKEGRVFLVLWAEPAGESHASVASQVEPIDRSVFVGAHNERVYSKVRRFVVIREGTNYCSAVPITTYGGKGVAKPSVNKSEHAIIHTSRTAPQAHPNEQPTRADSGGMRPLPIRVVPDDPVETLDPMSRIDFGKISTIQHNLKVRPMGMVHQGSLNALSTQFANVWTKTSSSSQETVVAGPSNSRSNQTSAPGGSGGSKSRSGRGSKSSKRPVRQQSDDDSSEDDDGDEDDDGSETEIDSRSRKPMSRYRTSAEVTQAAAGRAQPSQAQASTAPTQVPWAVRVQQAQDAYSRLLQQGNTREQAFRRMVLGLQQQGKSAQTADAEVRALLSGNRP